MLYASLSCDAAVIPSVEKINEDNLYALLDVQWNFGDNSNEIAVEEFRRPGGGGGGGAGAGNAHKFSINTFLMIFAIFLLTMK